MRRRLECTHEDAISSSFPFALYTVDPRGSLYSLVFLYHDASTTDSLSFTLSVFALPWNPG
ncbi:hypothetical protein NKDENANG_03892 [Candidatus Entotheonellaceae bacterium PAL068K]